MFFRIEINNEENMLKFGAKLSKIVQPGCVIFLNGNLGAGKTTLTRGFLRGLNYSGKVKSPTYTLVETYDTQQVHHFDLYRLNHPAELDDIGLEEYFTTHTIVLIEWPEKGAGRLLPPDLSCNIEITQSGRLLELVGHSLRGEEIIRRLSSE